LEVGGYNPAYVFGVEDTDLARRIWASNRQLWIDPHQFIIHDHVPVGRNLRKESYFYVRNRILIGVLTLPLWYGIPIGLAQAVKRLLQQPYKISGLLGLVAGIFVSVKYFGHRKPLSLAQLRALEALTA
jgi:GT2 family glycosyltransferase